MKESTTMKWISASEIPQGEGEYIPVLVSDGILVEFAVWNKTEQAFQSEIDAKISNEITYWMYPQQVFSPQQMMKLSGMKTPWDKE